MPATKIPGLSGLLGFLLNDVALGVQKITTAVAVNPETGEPLSGANVAAQKSTAGGFLQFILTGFGALGVQRIPAIVLVDPVTGDALTSLGGGSAGVATRGVLSAAETWGDAWQIPAASTTDLGELKMHRLYIRLGEGTRTTGQTVIEVVDGAIVSPNPPAWVRISGGYVQLSSAFGGYGLRYVISAVTTTAAGSGLVIPPSAWGDGNPITYTYAYLINPSGSYNDSGSELNDGTITGSSNAVLVGWQNAMSTSAGGSDTLTMTLPSNDQTVSKVIVYSAHETGVGISIPGNIYVHTGTGGSKALVATYTPSTSDPTVGNVGGWTIYKHEITLPTDTTAGALTISVRRGVEPWVMFSEIQLKS